MLIGIFDVFFGKDTPLSVLLITGNWCEKFDLICFGSYFSDHCHLAG